MRLREMRQDRTKKKTAESDGSIFSSPIFSPLLREKLGNEKFSIETMRPSLQQQMSDGSERCKVSITKHNRIQLGDVGGRNRLLQHYRCAHA